MTLPKGEKMLKIEFDFDPDKLMNGFEKNIIKEMLSKINTGLTGVTCANHHQPPTITFLGVKLHKLKIRVETCCDDFEKDISNRISDILN